MVDQVPLYKDVYGGWLSSRNDGRVWRDSPIQTTLTKLDVIAADSTVTVQTSWFFYCFVPAHLLGDAAYPRSREQYMIPPFKNTSWAVAPGRQNCQQTLETLHKVL